MMTFSGTSLKEVKHMAFLTAREKTTVLFTGAFSFISSHITASFRVNAPLSWLTACDPENIIRKKTLQKNV
jgi:hypothetical protein